MKDADLILKMSKEMCKAKNVTNMILKYENISNFHIESNFDKLSVNIHEKNRYVLTGILQAQKDQNNLLATQQIAAKIQQNLQKCTNPNTKIQILLKTSPLGQNLPKLCVRDLFSSTSSELDFCELKIATLIVFWKPFLDAFPSRELCTDFATNYKKIYGENLNFISIAIHASYENTQNLINDYEINENVKYFWMSSSNIKKLKETIPDIDLGAYYYILVNTGSQIVSAGNPQEINLKEEFDKILVTSAGTKNVGEKKKMEEIKEEFDGEEDLMEDIKESKETNKIIDENIEKQENEEKNMELKEEKKFTSKAYHFISFEDAKNEIMSFITKNTEKIQNVRKFVKRFKICLNESFRAKSYDTEFNNQGASIQLISPISEKYQSNVEPFFHEFESYFSKLLTTYTSGPIYGRNNKFDICDSENLFMKCKKCQLENSRVVCIKCEDYKFCYKCFLENSSTQKHKHLLFFEDQNSFFDEMLPRCKTKILSKYQSKTCSVCLSNLITKSNIAFLCSVCQNLILCKECFEKNVLKTDTGKQQADVIQKFPHHNFISHFYTIIPLN